MSIISIGERIAELRKAYSMTQEEFASAVGVSAQTVSKWENSVTMPDIMLLPVIAGIFNITVDELYGKKKNRTISFNDVPYEAYDALLFSVNRGFYKGEANGPSPEEETVITKKFFAEKPEWQTEIVADDGKGVYANGEMGIAYMKTREESLKLFDVPRMKEYLACLADENFLKLLKYQLEDPDRTYTASSAAKKCGIGEEIAAEIIEKLIKYGYVSKNTLDLGEEKVDIYSAEGKGRWLLLYSLINIAKTLSDYKDFYRGYRG